MRTITEKLESFLKMLFPTRVLFDDGTFIEYLDREAILYAEKDGHQMEVVWYFQKGRMKGRVLQTSDINYWDSPHETEQISSQKVEEILQKIVEYSRKRNIPLEIK
jgi:hypothetical protein